MELVRRLLRYVRPHAGLAAASLTAMLAYAALDAFSFTLLIPFLQVLFEGAAAPALGPLAGPGGPLGGAIGRAVARWIDGTSPMAALRNVVLLMFFVFLAKNIFGYVHQYTLAVVQGRVTRDIRRDLYQHLLRLDLPFFASTRAGQTIVRLTSDIDQLRMLVTTNVAQAILAAVQVLAFVGLLFLLSWKLTLVALLTLPPMLGLWARLRTKLRRGGLRMLHAGGELTAHLQETLQAMRVVKACGAEVVEARRFGELAQAHYRATVRNDRWRLFFPPATEMISAAGVLALLWYGSFLVLGERSLQAAEFLAALAMAMKTLAPAKYLGQFPALVQPGLAAAERAFELLRLEPRVREAPDALPVRGFQRAIELRDVGFAYEPGRPVLQGVNLTIRRGMAVALVGPSGAGKSTLVDLLPRFYDVTEGQIFLDGVDIRRLKLDELRALFGIVPQETMLFHATVWENIAYGCPEATPAMVEAAARAAHAHEFIRQLPEGYDTVLGERGVRLSGGQRQRIAIARALVRNPPILILDEATSALDAESERQVQAAIAGLMRERTVIVIAHRLSTVREADWVVVLQNGRLVEQGPPAALLAREGVFQRLWRLQAVAHPIGEA